MKPVTWDTKKNEILIVERGISFELVASLLDTDGLIDIIDHPNPQKYPDQGVFVVRAMEYIYMVPFLETEKEIRLITIIPSRKAVKKYGKKG